MVSKTDSDKIDAESGQGKTEFSVFPDVTCDWCRYMANQ